MKKHISGFTLIEILITFFILSILASTAAPSFANFQRNSLVTSNANNLISSINFAKSEAMKKNLPTLLVPFNNDGDWSKGWKIYIDNDFSGSFTNKDLLINEHQIDNTNILIRGNGTANGTSGFLRFDGSGFPKEVNGAFSANTLSIGYCTSGCQSTNPSYDSVRYVKIAKTGRVRSCDPNKDSSCTFTLDS